VWIRAIRVQPDLIRADPRCRAGTAFVIIARLC
jgi:hypothetical protein